MLLLREKPAKIFYLWSGLAVFGAYFLTFGMKLPVIDSGDKTAIAALFALIAAISFAASTVLSKRALRNIDYRNGTYLRFLITAILMLIIVTFQKDISSVTEVTQNQWIIFFVIAFTSGGTAIFFYYYGLKEISASVATICELAFPLTAVVLEYILRGNVLDWFQWFGAVLLVISIMQVSRLNSEEK
jgi:drug/metabolite transporter (DMT)-like permease